MTSSIFIDLTLEDQILEVKTYFKNLGADLPKKLSAKGIDDDITQIISVCHLCFKETPESVVESVLNSIVSILAIIPPKQAEKPILAFSEKLCKVPSPNLGGVALRVLWLLYQLLEEPCTVRFQVYYNLVQIAQKVDMVRHIFTSVDDMKKQLASAPISVEQMQKLLRLLHTALVKSKQSDLAAKVMIELLGTYTEENAGQAKEDAERCIVTAISDPQTYLFDPLLVLKPIQALKGEKLFDLLNIFAADKLTTYLNFYKSNKDFIQNSNLDHSQNVKKMRLLTFVQMAEISDEINFEAMQKELHIGEMEVEAFIIEALKTKLVKVRMNQTQKKVHISSAMNRTFGTAQWQQLRDALKNWKINLKSVEGTLKAQMPPPNEIAAPI